MHATVNRLFPQIARRGRQIGQIVVAEGLGGMGGRIRKVLADRLQPAAGSLPVLSADVLGADLRRKGAWSWRRARAAEPLTINWITTPPGIGSGGHTTLFRVINHLARMGCRNQVYFYDIHRADHRYYCEIARTYFGFQGGIFSMEEQMMDAHAVVATSWPTAYRAFNTRAMGKRFYFVQDFEPAFYPTGTEAVLAENTYHMDFHALTAGGWLAEKLTRDYAMAADPFPFGCDTSRYGRDPGSSRTGVAFYARPGAARRGFELGLLAMEALARRQPQAELHFYGEKIGPLGFPFIDHGPVRPHELNAIYNRCFAGLSLSFTNVSLVPHEMLAAGCIPVVNDAPHNRMVLDNPFVSYAAPEPHALATSLETLLLRPDFDTLSREAARSVGATSWEAAGNAVLAVFERELREGGATAQEPLLKDGRQACSA